MKRSISFSINGERRELEVETDATLLEVLRDQCGLGSVRESCGIGVCGACTVLVDGDPISGCLYLAPLAAGRSILTIEGLGAADALDPLQEAFVKAQAFQCSDCTPGMILSAKALLATNPTPSREEIAGYLAGNLCRCGSYERILDAVQGLSPSAALVETPDPTAHDMHKASDSDQVTRPDEGDQ
jgi:aerobic-type carbon monoxide dehydrogenase small subunit (CoxS/CutS family)